MLTAETPIVKPTFEDRNINVNLHYMALFGTCFVSQMENEALSVYHDDNNILDNTKITTKKIQV